MIAADHGEPDHTRHTVELRGNVWSTVRHGHGSQLVLFVHGWANEAASWAPLTSRLDPRRLEMIAVDLPGCGDSPPLPAGRASIANLAENLLELLGTRGGDPPILVGHSFGAAIVLEMALQAGDLVAGVVAIAPAATGGMTFVTDEQFESLRHPTDDALVALARAAFHRPPPTSDFEQMLRTVRRADRSHYEGALQAMRDLDLGDRLGDLAPPALVIAGDRDRHVPLREHLRTFEACRVGGLQVFHDVGHAPHWEVGDETAEVVHRFIEENTTP